MIQRPGNCPNCAHWDPFHASWFDPNKEVADPVRVKDWDQELFTLLCRGDGPYPRITVEHEDGDWVYFFTRSGKTIERWPISVLVSGIPPAERVGETWRQK